MHSYIISNLPASCKLLNTLLVFPMRENNKNSRIKFIPHIIVGLIFFLLVLINFVKKFILKSDLKKDIVEIINLSKIESRKNFQECFRQSVSLQRALNKIYKDHMLSLAFPDSIQFLF